MPMYFPNVYIHVLRNLGFAVDREGHLIPPLPSLLGQLSYECTVYLSQPSWKVIPMLKKVLWHSGSKAVVMMWQRAWK